MAFYMHFGWRDIIHDHISYIVQVPKLTRERANQFLIASAAIWGMFVVTIYTEVLYL